MYTVLWLSPVGTHLWAQVDSRREVAALLIEKGLENDDSVIIFGPDAEEAVISTEDIFASL